MAYDVPDVEEYTYVDATFGATSVTHYMVGPYGKVGFVRDMSCEVTTTLVGTTTVPEIDVGTAGGDTTYGRFRLGTSATAGYTAGAIYRASALATSGLPPRTLNDYTGHVVLDGGPYGSQGIAGGSYGTQVPLGRIPLNTPFIITNKAGTGGTPAGGGIVRVVIEWLGNNMGGV